MNRSALVLAAFVLVACARSQHGVADGSGATSASCGSLGGACTTEGATCSPAAVGSGWSHALTCTSGKWTEMEIAPLPRGRTQASPRSLPKLDTSCNVDADCVVVSDEVRDRAPESYACCPGCSQIAASATWYAQFQAACSAAPAPTCPPIGCAMAVARAECHAHVCQLAKSK